MYYYLIYNSSIGNHYELEKRYLTTILYASILYILTHAFLSSSQSEFAKKIRNYFWMIFILDCCSMSYIYYFDSDSDQHTENNLVDNILNQINNVKNKLNNTINKNQIPNLNEENNENSENNISNDNNESKTGKKEILDQSNSNNNDSINLNNQKQNNHNIQLESISKQSFNNKINENQDQLSSEIPNDVSDNVGDLSHLMNDQVTISSSSESSNRNRSSTSSNINELKQTQNISSTPIKKIAKNKKNQLSKNINYSLDKVNYSLENISDNASDSGSDVGSDCEFDMDSFEQSLDI